MTSPYKPMLPSGEWFAEQHAKWWNDPYRSYQHGRRAELDAAGDSGAARSLPSQTSDGQRHKHATPLGRIPEAQRQRDLHQAQGTVEKQAGSAAENIIADRTSADRLDGPGVRPVDGATSGEDEKNPSGGLGVPVPLHADMDGAELQPASWNIQELRMLAPSDDDMSGKLCLNPSCNRPLRPKRTHEGQKAYAKRKFCSHKCSYVYQNRASRLRWNGARQKGQNIRAVKSAQTIEEWLRLNNGPTVCPPRYAAPIFHEVRSERFARKDGRVR